MKCGVGKRLPSQYIEMGKFYHGKEPTHPSHIKLLTMASPPYSQLYEENFSTATKKSSTMDTTYEHILKIYLSLNKYQSYHSGEDITYHDLKKKNRTDGQLISGRHFHDMEKLGIKCYKKALSYCAHKYDLKMCSVHESGT